MLTRDSRIYQMSARGEEEWARFSKEAWDRHKPPCFKAEKRGRFTVYRHLIHYEKSDNPNYKLFMVCVCGNKTLCHA